MSDSSSMGSWHDVRGVQSYVSQVGRIADALSTDDSLAQRVIDAVHSGSSSAIERVFTDIGVESEVSLSILDRTETDEDTDKSAGETIARTASKPTRTRTITVTIGIGPISISVTVKKDSK
jgi:hypothetical protein